MRGKDFVMAKMTMTVAALSMLMTGAGAWAAPSCNSHREFPAVDLSQPVTTITTKSGKSGVEAFKAIGVKTIARYYDWVDEETTCKSLFPKESDALIAAGFNIVTIFQHANSDPETFLDKSRGAKDAREALKMAGANGQPPGSAIYFAVDGVDQTIKDAVFEWRVNNGQNVSAARKKRLLRADPSYRKHIQFYERFRKYYRSAFNKSADAVNERTILPFVTHYFSEVNRVIKADGRYRIGVYGSGTVCKHIQEKGLAEFCWLAMSSGWPGTKAYRTSGKWHMAQQLTTFCKGWQFNGRETARFDFNRIRSGDVGQWSKKGRVTAAPGLPAKCKPSW
jgi:Domain of unknown function (DUF1906)